MYSRPMILNRFKKTNKKKFYLKLFILFPVNGNPLQRATSLPNPCLPTPSSPSTADPEHHQNHDILPFYAGRILSSPEIAAGGVPF